MPVPGPRTQERPLPGYDNPGLEQPTRINPWLWPKSIVWPGRSPATMVVDLRGEILGAGQIRYLWKQAVNLFPAQAAYSWSENAPQPGRPIISPRGFQITRALRYMTRSVYHAGGTDNSRYEGLHTKIPKFNRGRFVTTGGGQVRYGPTIRNRVTSFGSRVPPRNPPLPGAQQ